MVKVSVIIPTHNRLELLKKAITSVLVQTYKDWELIVVDDGDISAEGIVHGFSDSRIKYIRHESPHQGGSTARNTGIKTSSGKFIAFLDDDDEWLSKKLEIQMEVFEPTPDEVGFCFSAVKNVFDDKVISTSGKVPGGIGFYFERALSRFSGFLTVTLVVKKDALDQVGYFDESLPSHQEIDLMIRLSKRFKGLGIKKPLVIVNMKKHDSIGASLERRIQGREMVLGKYFEDFQKRPNVLARHYFQLGIWNRDSGKDKEAKEYFSKALKANFSLRYLWHFLKI